MRFRVLSPGAALCGLAVVSCAAPSDSDERVAIARSELGQGLVFESEPNGTVALAMPLGTDALIRAAIFPAGDVDYYSFNAAAGDRVHVATMTAASVYGDDTIVDLLDTDGVTVLQIDDDNGSFGARSSSIAGHLLLAAGTYYLRIQPGTNNLIVSSYDFHFRLQSGSPTAEIEPNDTPGQAQPLPSSGWIAGSTGSTSDIDDYSITLNAGDTVFVSLDLDPTSSHISLQWPGNLSMGPFGGVLATADDPGALAPPDTVYPDSEALAMTVKDAGTYHIVVGTSAGAQSAGDYGLSVSVQPAAPPPGPCTTYTSSDVPKTIPLGTNIVTSTLTIPGHPRIADLDVALSLTHASMPDLDVSLQSPAGNENLLFTDVGSSAVTGMDLVLDDEAALPIGTSDAMTGMRYMPESKYDLRWFDGEDAGGTWTLVLRDDMNANGGVLNGWSLTVCEPPSAPPSCPPGTTFGVLYSTDFEADTGGFTHSGMTDSWAWGLPTKPPINGCNSGTKCFKTNLSGEYPQVSSQDLLSPPISLVDVVGPIRLRWAQKFQMGYYMVDHLFVEVAQAGNINPQRLFEWKGAEMYDLVGSTPVVPIHQSAGWGVVEASLDAYAGQFVQVRYHLDSSSQITYSGLAVDDVEVAGCLAFACGDGVVGGTEQCDDGNLTDGDGCDGNCKPTGCGNGVQTAGEACDDGNLTSGDGCDSNCKPTGCGNGVKTAGEACDDGNLTDGDGCDSNCKPTGCGNTITTAGEECDDGNLVNGDGCDSNCTLTGCGNGIKTIGENCDDGNDVNGDGCDENCTTSACGNGVVGGAEECDDGNPYNGDGCDENCLLEGSGGTGGTGGATGTGGTGGGGATSTGTGGETTSTGTGGGNGGTGGTGGTGGGTSTGGSGGSAPATTGSGGATTSTSSDTAPSGGAGGDDLALEPAGCGCAVPGAPAGASSWAGLLVLALARLRRQRSRRGRDERGAERR